MNNQHITTFADIEAYDNAIINKNYVRPHVARITKHKIIRYKPSKPKDITFKINDIVHTCPEDLTWYEWWKLGYDIHSQLGNGTLGGWEYSDDEEVKNHSIINGAGLPILSQYGYWPNGNNIIYNGEVYKTDISSVQDQ